MVDSLPWSDVASGRRWLRDREIRLEADRAALSALRDSVARAFRNQAPFHLVYVRDQGWVWRSSSARGPRRVFARSAGFLAALADLPPATAAWYRDQERRRIDLMGSERLRAFECRVARRWLKDMEALQRNPFEPMQD